MKRARVAVPLLVALLVGSSCGGGGGGGTSPDSFADDVCGAMRTWVQAIQDRAASLQSELGPSPSVDEGKQALRGFLDDSSAATEELISDINAAGVPDVDNGEDVVDRLLDAFQAAEGIFEDAQSKVDDLPANPQQFATAAQALGNSANQALNQLGDSLTALNSNAELNAAFANSDECRNIGG